jgi:PTH1 family peptidyl-tRNA hydrolase
MKLIFAQGNPGKEYSGTRHNVGFYMIDALAQEHGAEFTKKPKFHAEIAEISVNGEKTLLVKPTTFYNETGQAARLLTDFYKLDPKTDLLVVHDDLALPFGTVRTRLSGSDAGNNGVKSLNAHLGMQHARVKVGVYNDLRDRIHDADFVLGRFTKEESELLPDLYKNVKVFINAFINGTFEPTKVSL